MKSFIYRIIRYLNYILILALFLSYISIYINPEKIWLFAFFGLSYPFLLFANVIFILFWIFKKKRFFIIPLIAVLIGWGYISNFVQISSKKKNDDKINQQKSVSILSYNVRLFDLYNWSEKDEASNQIFDFINTNDPDIICFQEFFTRNTNGLTTDSIFKKLNNKYFVHIGYTIENSNFNYGIATFSKYPIVNRGIIKFNNSSNSSIYTDVVVKTDTIRIFNNHLQSIRFNKNNYSFISNSKDLKDDEKMKEILDISIRLKDAFIKRPGQAKILSRHIKKSPFPVFVCGDFNDSPVSYTYHTLQKGLNDSFREAGRGFGNTYMGKFPSFRIDYILHSKDIVCNQFNISKIKLSDHYPIIGEFYLN